MVKLNLIAKGLEQERIKEYLENNVSELLAEKINNGTKITKEDKTLLNKKDLTGFWNFATNKAKETAEKGSSGAYVDDNTVFGWAIHYFEEETIEGTLYNEDGTEYKPTIKKVEKQITKPKIVPKQENKQTSLFDLLNSNKEKENQIEQKELNIIDENEEEISEEEIEEILNNEIKTNDKIEVDLETGEIIEKEIKTVDIETAKMLCSMLDGKLLIK